MTNALRFARAAPALAMSYISVVITLVYGYLFFDEVGPPRNHCALSSRAGCICTLDSPKVCSVNSSQLQASTKA